MRTLFLLIISLFSITLSAQENKLGCDNVIDFADYKGQTFLSFMQQTVKPTLDDYALNGYTIANTAQVRKTLNAVSGKVRWAAGRAARGQANLLKIVDRLEGQNTNMYELPTMISRVDSGVNRYKLSTFIGLASCAGAIIKFAPGHFAYNIHYGTGAQERDEQTGRSFGEGFARGADDASDKNYLKDLEEFGHEHADSMDAFYQSLIKSLANSDSNNFKGISNFGKVLLTDFLAVYTAEQARNLMDDRISTHWDAALLEVTLIGAFHAGQEEIKLFYKDPYTGRTSFTDTVYNQDNGCSTKQRKLRKARVFDYWQFSSSTNTRHCKRSGINITRREFRKLGQLITKYELKNNPELVRNIAKLIGSYPRGRYNIFNKLSGFFINASTDKALDEELARDLANAFSAFLAQVKKDAGTITKLIEAGELK
jgi:hypothetical protein